MFVQMITLGVLDILKMTQVLLEPLYITCAGRVLLFSLVALCSPDPHAQNLRSICVNVEFASTSQTTPGAPGTLQKLKWDPNCKIVDLV